MPEPVDIRDRALSPRPARDLTRRQLLAAASGALVAAELAPRGGRLARAQDHGRIRPPVAVPEIKVTTNAGVVTTLPELLRNRTTALQTMFTSCTSTCPILGAIFARVQTLLPDQVARGIQLVSVSIDPERDQPRALSQWLRRLHARPGWLAAAPRGDGMDALKAFTGRGRNPADDHSTQIQIINRDALLVWRTSELPDADEIADLLRRAG
jgi:protein SCO1